MIAFKISFIWHIIFPTTFSRVEKFQKRFVATEGKTVVRKKKEKKVSSPRKTSKLLTSTPKRVKKDVKKDAAKKDAKKEK